MANSTASVYKTIEIHTVPQTIYLLERLIAETGNVAGNFHYPLHPFQPPKKRQIPLKTEQYPASSE